MIPHNTTVISLGEYEVAVRPIPPIAMARLLGRQSALLPPEPPLPKVMVRSIAGHEEEVAASPDTPEYQKWLVEVEQWEQKCKELRAQIELENQLFCYDYAIVAWRRIGTEEWQYEPDETYAVPTAYARHGISTSNDRRVEFIVNELLTQVEYLEQIQRAMYPSVDYESNPAPIEEQEVADMMRLFRNSPEERKDRRMGGDGSRRGEHQNEPACHGDVGCEKVGKRPRFLVRLFS